MYSNKNIIKQLREERSLSQRALAHKANVSNTVISRLEVSNNAKRSTLMKIASAFDVVPDEILAAYGFLPYKKH